MCYGQNTDSLTGKSETKEGSTDFTARNTLLSLEVTGLLPGTIYFYQVNASNSHGWTLSDVHNFITSDISLTRKLFLILECLLIPIHTHHIIIFVHTFHYGNTEDGASMQSDVGLIVGGVVAVVLIVSLAVTAIIITVLILKHKHARSVQVMGAQIQPLLEILYAYREAHDNQLANTTANEMKVYDEVMPKQSSEYEIPTAQCAVFGKVNQPSHGDQTEEHVYERISS